jgi:hypothetical protein
MAMRFFAMRVHLAPKVELGDAVFLSILLGVFDGKTNLSALRHQIQLWCPIWKRPLLVHGFTEFARHF